MSDLVERAREFLFKRRRAYQRVLDKNNKDVELILRDLSKFCRAHETTHNPDQRLSAVLEGRREVWLRIQQHLNLTEDELWSLYYRKE